MIFLLDANIPPSLAEDINGHEVIHIKTFPYGTSTNDGVINEYCAFNNCVLITKDSDFYDSFMLKKKPPKLILVKLGNKRLRELRSYFRKNWNQIEKLIADHSLIVLTPDSIKVLQ
jgi:predicted nuclease of predicted toxin-antitoxin system